MDKNDEIHFYVSTITFILLKCRNMPWFECRYLCFHAYSILLYHTGQHAICYRNKTQLEMTPAH